MSSTDARAAPIGVVVPLYDAAATVPRTLASLLAQTDPGWRAVVVDDGSRDDGPALVAGVGDPRVRLVRQPNRGVSAARNRGISALDTPLVAFLDADDTWDADMVATLRALATAQPAAAVYATSYRFRRPGEVPYPARLAAAGRIGRTGRLEDYFAVAVRSDPPLWTSAVAVRRAALEAVGGFPVGVASGEDLLVWARLALRYPIAYCAEPRATYWLVASAQHRPGRAPAAVDVVGEEFGRMLAAHPDVPGLREYVALWHRMRAVHFLETGDLAVARRELGREAALAGPRARGLLIAAISCLPPALARSAFHALKRLQRRRLAARPRAAARAGVPGGSREG